MGATDQLSKEDWQQTLRLTSAVRLTCFQQTMNQFRRQRAGRLSLWRPTPHTPRIGMSAYGASKAALKARR